MDFAAPVPAEIATLLVGYFSQTLSSMDRDRLDTWICESDAHMRIFEQCLEVSLQPKSFEPHPIDEIVIERMHLN